MINDKLKEEIFAELQKQKEDEELKASQIDYFLNHNDTYYHNICEQNKLKKDIAFDSYNKQDISKKQKQLDLLKIEQEKLLKDFGYSLQDSKPQYKCELCQDTGIVAGGYCKCFIKLYNQKLMAQNGVDLSNAVPLSKYDISVYKSNSGQMAKIYRIAKEYVVNFDKLNIKNLLLCGGTGLGKTFLSKSIAKEILDSGHSVLFTSVFSLNQAFTNEHYNNRNSTTNSLACYLDVDLLVIDDLGTQSIIKNVTVEYLLNLLDERNLKNKSTIISTNLSLAGIENVLSARLASRLQDSTNYLPLVFDGEDLRKR